MVNLEFSEHHYFDDFLSIIPELNALIRVLKDCLLQIRNGYAFKRNTCIICSFVAQTLNNSVVNESL